MKKINNTFLDRSSLVGEWLLDGNANDTAGTNNGTATNVTWASASRGYVEEVGSFNGSSSYIDIADTPFDFISDFSVFQLIEYNDFTTTTDTRSFGKRENGADGWMILATTGGKMRVDFYGNSGTYYTNSTPSTTFVTGQKYLIGFTYNNTTKLLQCYIDGVADGSVTTAGIPTVNNVNLRIGRIGTSYFDGEIGLNRVYNKTLSQQEINSLYQEGLRKFGPTQSTTTIPVSGLVASYDYDNITLDTSGNGNDGTATSVTTQKVGQQNVGVYKSASTSYSTIPNSAIPWGTNDISISMDITFDVTGGNRGLVMTARTGQGLLIYTSGSSLTFSKPNVVDLTVAITQDTKSHQLICYSNNIGMYIELDGQIIASNTNTANWVDPIGDDLYVGAYYNNGVVEPAWHLDGKIGLLRVYNKDLSLIERTTLNHEAKTKLSFPKYSLRSLEVGKVLEISKPQSGGTYIDQSGNGNDGTPTSVTDSTVGLNNVMSFNGTSSKVLLTSGLPSSLSSYSIVFSVKDDVSLNCLTSLYKRSDGARIITCEDVGGGVISAGHRNGAGSLQRFTVGDISTASYTRIGWTWDGSNIRIYNNGVLQSTNSVTSIEVISSTNYIIGACDNAPLVAIGNYSECSISNYEFIPNKTRSDIEMQQDYYSSKLI